MGIPFEQLASLSAPEAALSVFLHGWPLVLACFFAGMVDSIGGGGGLITVPALLSAGVPALNLLGTNKGMSTFGSSVAVYRYRQAGLLPSLPGARGWAWLTLIVIAISGGAIGALISQTAAFLAHLRVLIPVLLIGVMLFLGKRWFFSSNGAHRSGHSSVSSMSWGVAIIAAYDGLFGPGTGAFLLSYFERIGFGTVQANAITKVFNLSSNFGALLFFAFRGTVIWPVSLTCAVAMMLGNYAGSGIVLSRGQAWIRATVMTVTAGMLLRYFLTG